MRSRQVNFYVHPAEQHWLEEIIKEAGPFTIVAGRAQHGRVRNCSTTIIEEFGREDLKIYLVRPEDVDKIRLVSAPNRPEQFVDDLRSPVVEFWRCYFGDHLLRRGRLYMVDSYYDGHDHLVKKPEEFLTWGRQLIELVKDCMRRRPDGDYSSPVASELEAAGQVRLTAA